MANLYKSRVCAVGSEQDIRHVLIHMLDNCGYLPDEDELPHLSLSDLLEMVQMRAREDGDPGDTFLYEMIAEMRFGSAIPGTCHMKVQPHDCGLWTACFSYDSPSPFQQHEWLSLHNHASRILLVAQKASSDFTLDKGEMIFTGGSAMDNWDRMAECWLWVITQYECGLPPEDAVRKLEKLEKILVEEEYDTDIPSLLRSCRSYLEALALETSEPQALRSAMERCLEKGDFLRLAELQHTVAESVLWETEHNAKWFACLDMVMDAWDKAHGQEGDAAGKPVFHEE